MLAHQVALAQGPVVGILEGKATLIRQAAKLNLAEGMAVQNEDILETAAAAFVQLEYPDGVRIGVGPNSRLTFAPRGPLRGSLNARVYLLQGWLKLSQPSAKPAGAESVTPQFELASLTGATILVSNANEFAAFVESGSAKLTDRNSNAAPVPLASGTFVSVPVGDTPKFSGRPSPAFLEQMPRPFRDPLPGRAGRYRDAVITPKALGDVGYDDIAAWLVAEPGLRQPMLERWRPRLRDKPFRAAMIAHLPAHPEWDPYLFPEKAAKKKADEKRARDLKAAAAAAAAASQRAASEARAQN